jgi:hypothetical protein
MANMSYVSLTALLVAPLFIINGPAQAATPAATTKDPDIVRISQDTQGGNDVPFETGLERRQFSLSSDGSAFVYSSIEFLNDAAGSPAPAVSVVRLRNTENNKKLEISCRSKLPQFDAKSPGYPLLNPVVSANGQVVASGFGGYDDQFNGYADYVEVHTVNDKCNSKLTLRISPKDKPRSITGVALSSDGRYLAYSFKEPEADDSNPGKVEWDYNEGTAKISIVDLKKVSKTGQVDPSAESSVWSEKFSYSDGLVVIGVVSTPDAPAKVIVGRSNEQSDLSVDGAFQQVSSLTSKGDGERGELKHLVRYVPYGYSDFSMNDGGTVSAFTASTLFSEKNLPKQFAAYHIYDTNRAMDVFAKIYGGDSEMIRISKPLGCSDSDVACQPNFQSGQSYMSSTGEYIAFMTKADNLAKPDLNYSSDILVYSLKTGKLTAPVRVNGGKQPDNDCRYPAISSNGKIVAFVSFARNLAKLPDYEKETDDPVADLYVAKINQ